MRKICVVVTARPSYSRVKAALRAIQNHPDLELQLVVGASALLERYGKVVDVMRADGFEPKAEVHMVVEGETPITSAKTVGLGIVELSSVFNTLKPDAVVSVADRYETIATAIAAAYMGIPVVHIQGGEVTGSIDEKVRHSVTKLSDLHLVANKQAAERVKRMGEHESQIVVTGCPSIDLAAEVVARKDDIGLVSSMLESISRGVGTKLDIDQPYIICMQHPVTYEWDNAFEQATQTLEAVSETGIQCFWFWPNVDSGGDLTSKAIRTFRETRGTSNIHFLKNLPPESFLYLLNNSKCIVGNSSVGIRESAFLGVPTVNIGTRQAGRDRGRNVIDTCYDTEEISNALRYQTEQRYQSDLIYGDGLAGERIADALATSVLTTEKKLAY